MVHKINFDILSLNIKGKIFQEYALINNNFVIQLSDLKVLLIRAYVVYLIYAKYATKSISNLVQL